MDSEFKMEHMGFDAEERFEAWWGKSGLGSLMPHIKQFMERSFIEGASQMMDSCQEFIQPLLETVAQMIEEDSKNPRRNHER